MTNFERWNLFLRDIPSPQSYIDFSFYYLISAALQRRVWCGPEHRKMFPNLFIILVGDPGIGKGLVIKPVCEILKYHKLENPSEKPPQTDAKVVDVDPAIIEALNHANYANATGTTDFSKKTRLEKPLVIPVAANATTWEALVRAMSKATRRINYMEYDPHLQKNTVKIYTHASLCFALEEISSLFRRKTEDIVNFLNTAYDCGDYEYDTKTQGTDQVNRCCLNFFGGTQLSFVERTFNDAILNEGFSSRTWFIFETSNRFNTLKYPELDADQKEAVKTVIAHIKLLTEIYGPITFTQEAEEYLEHWWKNIHPFNKPNNSPKLVAYYARKNMHVKKLAMAMHFGEDASKNELHQPANAITKATCARAMAMLDKAELQMHYALNFNGANPLAVVGRKILVYIRRNGPQTTNELLCQFYDDVADWQLKDILNHLIVMKRIKLVEPLNRWDVIKDVEPVKESQQEPQQEIAI